LQFGYKPDCLLHKRILTIHVCVVNFEYSVSGGLSAGRPPIDNSDVNKRLWPI
jgi:hypothetical protein